MNKIESICAVIVTFNPNIERVRMQISRLLVQVNKIVLVDNDSKNIAELKDVLGINFSSDKIYAIHNEKNEGLGYAQNVGIKKAIAIGATKILLMDDDSIIENHFVEELLKAEQKLKEQGKSLGAIGPIYFNKSTNEQYPVTKYIGPFISRKTPKSVCVKASFLISSGTMIPVDVIKDVGFMNEDLFIDYIDVDWSFRAIKKGYDLYVTPNARMEHQIGEKRISFLGRKISYHSPQRKYYLFRNSIYMMKNPDIALGYKTREVVFNFIRFFVYLLYSKDKKAFVQYSFCGLFDGLKGKYGKCIYYF